MTQQVKCLACIVLPGGLGRGELLDYDEADPDGAAEALRQAGYETRRLTEHQRQIRAELARTDKSIYLRDDFMEARFWCR